MFSLGQQDGYHFVFTRASTQGDIHLLSRHNLWNRISLQTSSALTGGLWVQIWGSFIFSNRTVTGEKNRYIALILLPCWGRGAHLRYSWMGSSFSTEGAGGRQNSQLPLGTAVSLADYSQQIFLLCQDLPGTATWEAKTFPRQVELQKPAWSQKKLRNSRPQVAQTGPCVRVRHL